MTTNIMIKNKRIDTNNKITNLQINKDCTQKENIELIKKEKERQKKREETHGPNKNMYLDFSKLI